MATIAELRQQRARLWEQMKALHERARVENRDLSAEEQEQWDRLDAELNRLKSQIDREERLAVEESDLRQREPAVARSQVGSEAPSEKERRAAFVAYLRGGWNALTPEQRAYALNRVASLPLEVRALGVSTDAAGGYTVEDETIRAIDTAMLAFGGVREAGATVVQTSTGADLPIPTANDTTNKGVLLAENTQVTEQDPSFGQVVLSAYMYTSRLIRVSVQLLQDASFDIEAWLRERFAERLARITNEHFTTGTGVNQPQGVVTGATLGVTAASATSVAYAELVDLVHSVDPAYRRNARFMFHDSTLRALKKLTDTEGRPLWVPGVAVREPDTILGHQFVINQDMPQIAANAKAILFGDFSKYYIRDVQNMVVLRLSERYADFLQVGFLAFRRHDGRLVDAGTNPIKYLQMAAV